MAWSKESRQSRGYGPEWTKLRKRVMVRDKELCQPCLRKGRPTRATEVDHIMSKAKAKRLGWHPTKIDSMANCEAICTPCHLAKTAEETGRTYRPKVTTGLDGWPEEDAHSRK